jgi:hypothetical protein
MVGRTSFHDEGKLDTGASRYAKTKSWNTWAFMKLTKEPSDIGEKKNDLVFLFFGALPQKVTPLQLNY